MTGNRRTTLGLSHVFSASVRREDDGDAARTFDARIGGLPRLLSDPASAIGGAASSHV